MPTDVDCHVEGDAYKACQHIDWNCAPNGTGNGDCYCYMDGFLNEVTCTKPEGGCCLAGRLGGSCVCLADPARCEKYAAVAIPLERCP
jgi:hypothetical protein